MISVLAKRKHIIIVAILLSLLSLQPAYGIIPPLVIDGGLGVSTYAELQNSYTVVTSDGKVNHDPDIVSCDNGDLLIFYSKGNKFDDKHSIKMKRSSYLGKSWGSEVNVFTDPTYSVITPMVTNTSLGLVLKITKMNLDSFITDANWVMISQDNGFTWSTPVQVDDNFTAFSGSVGRILQVSSGELLLPIQGQNTGDSYWSAALMRSSNGINWTDFTIIANGQSAGRMYAEPWIIENGPGYLFALLRSDTVYPWTIWGANSNDYGQTWTAPTVRFVGNNRPATIKLTDGSNRLVTTYRRFQRPNYQYQYASMRISNDDGVTYGSEIFIDQSLSRENWNAGSAPVEVAPGIVAVVYCIATNADVPVVDVRFRYITSLIQNEPIVTTLDKVKGSSVYGDGFTVPSGVETAIPFTHEEFDTDTMHELTVNNGRIYIRTAGIYYVGAATVRWQPNDVGYRQVLIKKNGLLNSYISTVINDAVQINGTSLYIQSTPPRLYYFEVGDDIQVTLIQNSGQPLQTLAGGLLHLYPTFDIYRVGDK